MRRSHWRFACLVVVITIANVSSVCAQLVFNDGQTHAINGAAPDVSLTNNSTLLVLPGAAIMGRIQPSADARVNGISGFNSSVILTGGTVTGGVEIGASHSTPVGIFLVGGSFTATGGAVTGGTGYNNVIGGDALNLFSASATISGGTFSGSGGFEPGYGLTYINTGVGNLLSISGGTFLGGGPEGSQAANLTIGSGSATISGGTFQGLGTVRSVLGATLTNGAQLNISGGSFGAEIIAGSAAGGGSLNFFGSGLNFRPNFITPFGANGTLIGTLADGETIAQTIDFFGQGSFRLITQANEISFVSSAPFSVPEPASVIMMGIGLAVVGFVSRRVGSRLGPKKPCKPSP